MKIYILFFFALFACKITCRPNSLSFNFHTDHICEFPQPIRTKISECIEYNMPRNYKEEFERFNRCFGKDSFAEVINMICESNGRKNGVKEQYLYCFSLLTFDENEHPSVKQDIINCVSNIA
ncbi:uncharacterized protein LOC111634866 [Centruroides sculpturatus]|uniref:uncharacterized protein LOC111634866 n=1 Tax=Centruroides sculpturatus TaxID=218467 RepID=UPI000C6E5D77|nr:uncharacterized protein LOC111634866 [Centruroides sculpturatus]